MSLFEQLAGQALSSILGNNQQQGSTQLLQVAMSLLNSHGGLEGLLAKLNSGGLNQQVSSWVGTGDNESVTASQISSALGHNQIADLASQFGLPNEAISGGLAQLLPQLINQATPNGSTQGSDELFSQGLGLLEQMLAQK